MFRLVRAFNHAMAPYQCNELICAHFTRRDKEEAYPSTVCVLVGTVLQADSAATAQDPRLAGRPSGHGNQNEAQRRQVPGLPGIRRPEGGGQLQDHLCPWIRLLQIRRAPDFQGMFFFIGQG